MVSVHKFQDGDAQAVADLMVEMVGFYGAAIAPGLPVAEDLVRQSRRMDIVVAHQGCRLVGFATFTAMYPVAGLLAFTHVQQVYVGQDARRLGVARELMAAVARAARASGHTRVEWSTGKENTAAQALYGGLGASGSDKVQYVLDGDALDRLATVSAATSASQVPERCCRPV